MRPHRLGVSGRGLVGVLAASLVLTSVASAGPRGGSGGKGGGRLGDVSGGLGDATGAGRGGGTGGGGNAGQGGGGGGAGDSSWDDTRSYEDGYTDGRGRRIRYRRAHPSELYHRVEGANETVIVDSEGRIVRRIFHPLAPPGGTANFDLFLGVQKVFESDKAISLALSIDDRWFRLAGSVTRYVEPQMDGSELTLTLPTMTLGVRVDDRRATKAFVEAGVAVVNTANDPMVDTSITGPIAGVHVEHRLGSAALLGDAHVMGFESGVRAYRARVGLRFRALEAAFTILDFNVGPALFGPEVGIGF